MGEKIKGYANYGVLAHEKQTIFTVCNPEECTLSEKIEITLPDGWEVGENHMGDVLITSPEGENYMADEIISSWGNNPVLSWYDGTKGHRISLEWKTC